MRVPSNEAERTAIEKIQHMIDERGESLFTTEEADALRKFAKFMLALATLGSVGSAIKSIIVWLGVIIGGYMALKNGLAEWILAVIQGAKP